MKTPIKVLLTICLLLPALLHAGDRQTAPYAYEGTVTGLFCHACAAKVKAALEKMDGVTKVKITATEELGVQKIHLASSSPLITKEAAVKALGEDAKTFTILSLAKNP